MLAASVASAVHGAEDAAAAVEPETTGIPPAANGEEVDGGAKDGGETKDETKELLEQLTVTMVSAVVDERTLEIRDSPKHPGKRRIHLRLGNVGPPLTNDGDDQAAQAKSQTSKDALTKFVEKQMIWWKAAPEEHQAETDGDIPVVLADAWLLDGRHINSMLVKEGHLSNDPVYESELARNILSAEADEKKQEAYKELEQALTENERARAKLLQEQKAEQKREQERERELKKTIKEPIGFGGWLAMGVLGVIIVGAVTNFGRSAASSKKKSLPPGARKRSLWSRLWHKVKGA